MNTQAATALEVAHRIAPFPYDEDAETAEAIERHYVAQAIAAWADFQEGLALAFREQDDPDRAAALATRPDLGLLAALAVASTAAAVALNVVDDVEHQTAVAHEMWSITPEAGSLNGDHEIWLFDRADQMGINPADLNQHLDAHDFQSKAVTAPGRRLGGTS